MKRLTDLNPEYRTESGHVVVVLTVADGQGFTADRNACDHLQDRMPQVESVQVGEGTVEIHFQAGVSEEDARTILATRIRYEVPSQ